MEKEDSLKKQKLAEELGMKFDEATELFSEETLCSMQMVKVRGRKVGSVNVGCGAQNTCTNGGCTDINVLCDFNIVCAEVETTKPPVDLKWEGCPTVELPTPPVVQQDAICWPSPPIPTM